MVHIPTPKELETKIRANQEAELLRFKEVFAKAAMSWEGKDSLIKLSFAHLSTLKVATTLFKEELEKAGWEVRQVGSEQVEGATRGSVEQSLVWFIGPATPKPLQNPLDRLPQNQSYGSTFVSRVGEHVAYG